MESRHAFAEFSGLARFGSQADLPTSAASNTTALHHPACCAFGVFFFHPTHHSLGHPPAPPLPRRRPHNKTHFPLHRLDERLRMGAVVTSTTMDDLRCAPAFFFLPQPFCLPIRRNCAANAHGGAIPERRPRLSKANDTNATQTDLIRVLRCGWRHGIPNSTRAFRPPNDT